MYVRFIVYFHCMNKLAIVVVVVVVTFSWELLSEVCLMQKNKKNEGGWKSELLVGKG